jgi:hypothetical protein
MEASDLEERTFLPVSPPNWERMQCLKISWIKALAL